MTIDYSRPFTITQAITINGLCFDGLVSVGHDAGNIPPHWVDQIPDEVVYQAPEPVCSMPESVAVSDAIEPEEPELTDDSTEFHFD